MAMQKDTQSNDVIMSIVQWPGGNSCYDVMSGISNNHREAHGDDVIESFVSKEAHA